MVANETTLIPAGKLGGSHLWLLARTLTNLRTSFEWAWLDTVCQYRRSKIGPLWETINIAVTVVGLAVVYSGIFGGDTIHLIGYIGIGFIIWSAISFLVTEGCSTFVRNSSLILTSNISVDQYVGRTLFRALIIFVHHLAIYVAGVVLGFVPLGWLSLLALPGLFLLFINGVWVVTLLAFVCARYRDVELIVRNLLQLAFLITPVFWNYEQIATNRRFVVSYNVLFHFIDIIRSPLLGHQPSPKSYVVVLAVTVMGYAAAFATYRHMRRRLAYFL